MGLELLSSFLTAGSDLLCKTTHNIYFVFQFTHSHEVGNATLSTLQGFKFLLGLPDIRKELLP